MSSSRQLLLARGIRVIPDGGDRETATIGAGNTFTTPLYLCGAFNLSIAGSFAAAVTVQRSFDAGTTWLDVETFAAPIEIVGDEPEAALYRVGVKDGDFNSGSITVTLRQ